MTDDTQYTEPPLDAGEVETARFVLRRSRAQFAWKTGGLDAEALRRPHPPSSLTLARLVKHLALVEASRATMLVGGPLGEPWPGDPWPDDDVDVADDPWRWVWRTADGDDPRELYALWRSSGARVDAALDTVLSTGRGLDAPAAFVVDGTPVAVRRVLADLHDEYARHVGHADLMREAVDGLVGEDPPQD